MGSRTDEIDGIVARAGTHPVWGYAHCLRVHALACRIAEAEDFDYDEEVLHLSALLHDIGLYRAYARGEGKDHNRRSAIAARRLLRDRDFPEKRATTVLEAIERHPPGVAPGRSVEGALLKDAVALDYLGAIGLSRVFAMVGLEEDVPDLPSALRHAASLRRQLPGVLLLESSREISEVRCLQMDHFFEDVENSTANKKLL